MIFFKSKKSIKEIIPYNDKSPWNSNLVSLLWHYLVGVQASGNLKDKESNCKRYL
jgi:hypothetical protein